MSASPKKKTAARRTRSSGQQHHTAKRSVVAGENIQLSAKDKRILGRVRRFLSDALASADEIDNNIARGEARFFADNTGALRRCLNGCRHLCRGVAAVNIHARQEVAHRVQPWEEAA